MTKKLKSVINKDYFLENSPIGKNFNIDDIYQYFNIAEKLYIIPEIGQEQYDELLGQVIENKVSEVNSVLLLQLYPLLSYAITYQALPFLWANIAEVGITLGKSDNSDSVQLKDLDYISTRLVSTIETLKRQLRDWLDDYDDNYPMIKAYRESDNCPCGNKSKDKTKRLQMYTTRRQCTDIS